MNIFDLQPALELQTPQNRFMKDTSLPSAKYLETFAKFLYILCNLGKNLGQIFTKGFTKMQDSHQEFQEISHWSHIFNSSSNIQKVLTSGLMYPKLRL